MMFRTLCRSCEQLAIDRAKATDESRSVMFVGCSHYQVGATCFVEDGQIIDWSCWPAIDEQSFRLRAESIGVAYAQLNADVGLTDFDPNMSTRH